MKLSEHEKAVRGIRRLAHVYLDSMLDRLCDEHDSCRAWPPRIAILREYLDDVRVVDMLDWYPTVDHTAMLGEMMHVSDYSIGLNILVNLRHMLLVGIDTDLPPAEAERQISIFDRMDVDALALQIAWLVTEDCDLYAATMLFGTLVLAVVDGKLGVLDKREPGDTDHPAEGDPAETAILSRLLQGVDIDLDGEVAHD